MMNKWMTAAIGAAMLVGCAEGSDTGTKPDSIEIGAGDFTKGGDGKADSSVEAIFLDMAFSGYVLTNSSFNRNGQIEDQMLYTIGHLNDQNSIGRLDKLQLSNVRTSSENGMTRIDYDAILPVAWGRRNAVPANYTFRLPRDISISGQDAFTEKYKDDCVDFSQAHDVDRGSMWYYYRTETFRCTLDDADVMTTTASVSVSDINTTGKYPEYDKIWEDDVLKVVAIFGKYEDGATSSSDAGIAAYNRFVRKMKTDLSGLNVTVNPSVSNPGVDNPEVTFAGEIADGKSLEIVTLLVDNVRTAGFEFDQRYEALSREADLIVYSGHAGLGANIRALANKGDWQTGQYSIVFMNGCDTYAYVDSALNDAHARVNPDDATGTKYVDIVTNAMPAFFREVDRDTIAVIRGLMKFDDPQTFEQMFHGIDPLQVVLVSGEEDNTYVPGDTTGEVDENWQGMRESGSVARSENDHFETVLVGAGTYDFDLTGTDDADLYVRIGQAPTSTSYDCRPYRSGSTETCRVELTSPAKIFVMVNGWATNSSYELVGTKLGSIGGGDTISATNNDSVSIPDNDDNGTFSSVEISEAGEVAAVRVDLKITHTYRGDLTVYLTNGSTETVVYRGSGSSDNVILSAEPVAGFEGSSAQGTWTLRVVDSAARDIGTIDNWTLYLDI